MLAQDFRHSRSVQFTSCSDGSRLSAPRLLRMEAPRRVFGDT
jgi:hypothetical protein